MSFNQCNLICYFRKTLPFHPLSTSFCRREKITFVYNFVTAAILDENHAELNIPAKKHMFSIFRNFLSKSHKTIANRLKYDGIVL